MQSCRRILLNHIKDCNLLCNSSRTYQRKVFPLRYEEKITKEETKSVPDYFRKVYPEFIPQCDYEYRNKLCEKLERDDMIKRRMVLDIPEFYVGSILAVTVAEDSSPQKFTRFLGICISREGSGLRASFILRNIIDNIGIEILYELYCPLIQRIEIIKLEKRLDGNLRYLREALPEYSKFSEDMPAIYLPDVMEVPVNPLKVEMKSKNWAREHDATEIKGIEELFISESVKASHKTFFDRNKFDKYDLMKDYREAISEEEQALIYRDVLPHLPKMNAMRRGTAKAARRAVKYEESK